MNINYQGAGSSLAGGKNDGWALQSRAIEEAVAEALRLAKLEKAGADIDLGDSVAEVNKMFNSRTDYSKYAGSASALAARQANTIAAAQATKVNITINGKTRQIDVNNREQAFGLVDMFKELEAAANRTY